MKFCSCVRGRRAWRLRRNLQREQKEEDGKLKTRRLSDIQIGMSAFALKFSIIHERLKLNISDVYSTQQFLLHDEIIR